MTEHYYISVAGVSFRQQEIKETDIGTKCILEPEPNNQYDENAIKVINNKGKQIGYIPRIYNKIILEAINANFTIDCSIQCIKKVSDADTLWVQLHFEVTPP